MYSIKELYKIGNGPSSSHTIGPKRAAEEFIKRYPNCDKIKAKLYGSLALTGKGHLTDYIIVDTISPILCEIEFDIDKTFIDKWINKYESWLEQYPDNNHIVWTERDDKFEDIICGELGKKLGLCIFSVISCNRNYNSCRKVYNNSE